MFASGSVWSREFTRLCTTVFYKFRGKRREKKDITKRKKKKRTTKMRKRRRKGVYNRYVF